MEYINSLFRLVLDHQRCPPTVKFLFSFLDDLAENHRIDADTVHAWKSHRSEFVLGSHHKILLQL